MFPLEIVFLYRPKPTIVVYKGRKKKKKILKHTIKNCLYKMHILVKHSFSFYFKQFLFVFNLI